MKREATAKPRKMRAPVRVTMRTEIFLAIRAPQMTGKMDFKVKILNVDLDHLGKPSKYSRHLSGGEVREGKINTKKCF